MTATHPAWSVVVPTYGRGQALPGVLEALCGLRPPAGGFEVVLVDDGGPLPLDAIVEPFMPRLDLALHRKANGGPASARNLGVARARGDWIALTDDDCRPHADWLVRLAAAVAAEPEAMIGGATNNGLPDNLFSETSQLLADYVSARDADPSGQVGFIASNNMAMSRAGFLAVGGFDEIFPLAAGEDRDLCDRWGRAGRPIRLALGARIDHCHALSAGGFWRQHRNYGRGAVRVHDRRVAAAKTQTGRFEPLSFYADLMAYPFVARAERPWRKALLMLASQAATADGYVREWLARRRRSRCSHQA